MDAFAIRKWGDFIEIDQLLRVKRLFGVCGSPIADLM
jgi:hypothetical protein